MPATEMDKTPMDGSEQVGAEGLMPGRSRSVESLHQLRLMALLRDLVREEGASETAELLGISYRTLSRASESGRLTARMTETLERHLLAGGGSEAARQREEMGALRNRLKSLERLVGESGEKLGGGLKKVEAAIEALGKKQAGEVRHTERRLAKLEAGGGADAVSREASPGPRRRDYPDLVTPEPEPAEEHVYGDAAPLVAGWRKAMAEVRAGRKGVAGTEARIRRLELEVELIGRHGLTLPPRTYPWDEFDRRRQVEDRMERLDRVRVERNQALLRRWMRRVLTLWLWRN